MTRLRKESAKQAIFRMLNAKSIAMAGASNDPEKYGFMLFNTLIKSGYPGDLFPVNLKEKKIQGIRAYRSVRELPSEVDLVIIMVPSRFVPQIMREAADNGAAGVSICSGGFRELGNADLEKEVLYISKTRNLRVIGPNQMGFFYGPNKLNSLFYPAITKCGSLAMIGQSGGALMGLVQWAEEEHLHTASVVTLGNQVDLCEADFMEYFADDDNISAIAVYVEGVKDGRRFLDAMKYTSSRKPLTLIKCGRSSIGRAQASSHTGSLAGNWDVFYGACRQSGAILARDMETFYDHGKALSQLGPLPGKRLCTISNSGGHCSIVADEADRLGMEQAPFPHEAKEHLKQLKISPLASYRNPMDIAPATFDETVENTEKIVSYLDKLHLADVFLLSYSDPCTGLVESMMRLKQRMKTPFVVVYMGGHELQRRDLPRIQKLKVPTFATPERALRGIAAAMKAGKNGQGFFK